MDTHVIVRFHEAALKGKNRPMFIRQLADNLRRATMGAGVTRVWLGHLFVAIRLPEDVDWPLVEERVSNCFGVAKYYRAWQVPPDLANVKSLLTEELATDRSTLSA